MRSASGGDAVARFRRREVLAMGPAGSAPAEVRGSSTASSDSAGTIVSAAARDPTRHRQSNEQRTTHVRRAADTRQEAEGCTKDHRLSDSESSPLL